MADADEHEPEADDGQAVAQVEDEDDSDQGETEKEGLTIAHRQQGMDGEAAECQQRQPQKCRAFYLELAQQEGEEPELQEDHDIGSDPDAALGRRLAAHRGPGICERYRSH